MEVCHATEVVFGTPLVHCLHLHLTYANGPIPCAIALGHWQGLRPELVELVQEVRLASASQGFFELDLESQLLVLFCQQVF